MVDPTEFHRFADRTDKTLADIGVKQDAMMTTLARHDERLRSLQAPIEDGSKALTRREARIWSAGVVAVCASLKFLKLW